MHADTKRVLAAVVLLALVLTVFIAAVGCSKKTETTGTATVGKTVAPPTGGEKKGQGQSVSSGAAAPTTNAVRTK